MKYMVQGKDALNQKYKFIFLGYGLTVAWTMILWCSCLDGVKSKILTGIKFYFKI